MEKKIVMVIPSYWGRKAPGRWLPGDVVYDHATALNEEGTLQRLLESINILDDKNFEVVILGCSAAKEIELEVEEKLKQIIIQSNCPVNVKLFSHSQLMDLQTDVTKTNSEVTYLLSLEGYSQIRNACLYTPHLLGADIALLIDDDEIFDDPKFITKVRESVSIERPGVAGYYIEPELNGKYTYIRERTIPTWMTFWNKFKFQNEAFKNIIGNEPRLKVTPFSFGGNMAVLSSLFKNVPFDPNVNRGEDMDYVMNSKMCGVDFYLDNSLSIVHLPPKRPHPKYRQLREDMRRFVYQVQKLQKQYPVEGMKKISYKDLWPYPGYFLTPNLPLKIFLTSLLLALTNIFNFDLKGFFGALYNIRLVFYCPINAFDNFVKVKRDWVELMKIIGKLEGSKYFIFVKHKDN